MYQQPHSYPSSPSSTVYGPPQHHHSGTHHHGPQHAQYHQHQPSHQYGPLHQHGPHLGHYGSFPFHNGQIPAALGQQGLLTTPVVPPASPAPPAPAKDPAAAAAASGRKTGPTDKTVAKRYLNEVEVVARIDTQIQAWVKASMKSVYEEMRTVSQTRVDTMLQKYSVVVDSFHAQVLRTDGSDELRPSDDGNVYLRINHDSLEKYFGALHEVDQAVNTRLDQLVDAMESMKVDIADVAARPVVASAAVAGSSTAGPKKVKLVFKEHTKVLAQAGFKRLLNTAAGLAVGRGAADTCSKIYELKYPADPSEIAYHPPSYEPLPGEQPAPESVVAADGQLRYRELRIRPDRAWNASPNFEGISPVLQKMIDDHEEFGLPPGLTPSQLMNGWLKRSWTHMKDRYNQLHNGTRDEVKARWAKINQNQRRRKRLTGKGARWYQVAKNMVLGNSGSQAASQTQGHDLLQEALYREELQSAEESEAETVPGTPTKKITRLCRIPDFRSDQATNALRSLDVNLPPTRYRVIDSVQRIPERAVPPECRKWMIHADYVDRHPNCDPHLLPNVGPFTGEHSVASSADMLGSFRSSFRSMLEQQCRSTLEPEPLMWPSSSSTTALDQALDRAFASASASGASGDGTANSTLGVEREDPVTVQPLFSFQGLPDMPATRAVDGENDASVGSGELME
ncbi:hypothetical protein A4X03_0g7550 [Tilletia caries]|uniref:Uncharacterized protein n=5 Tax=Tilletia TaxID=13289 RepID=A0A8T8SP32_9BASI|nr:hypothetical protein A4X03_0g7550 [Tilletia caries]